MLISDPLTSNVIGSHVFVTYTSPCLYCLVEDDEFTVFHPLQDTEILSGVFYRSSFQIKEEEMKISCLALVS